MKTKLTAALLLVLITLLVGCQPGSQSSDDGADNRATSTSSTPVQPAANNPAGQQWVPENSSAQTEIGEWVKVEGGTFQMGDSKGRPNEVPVHEVKLNTFWIQAHEVTNRQFREFVEATGYTTVAEEKGGMWVYRAGWQDWQYVEGANWKHPLGPESSIEGGGALPVIGVAYEDAVAYAEWAGARLPTEAEWEYMARGGPELVPGARTVGWDSAETVGHPADGDYPTEWKGPDGNLSTEEFVKPGEGYANHWEGQWPKQNNTEDGYFYLAPAGATQPNQLGIHDVAGNVWEWTSDWYSADYYENSPVNNPQGPGSGDRRVVRGGSWFCSLSYCGSFRFGYRGASPTGRAWNNTGFRIARDTPPQSAESADRNASE